MLLQLLCESGANGSQSRLNEVGWAFNFNHEWIFLFSILYLFIHLYNFVFVRTHTSTIIPLYNPLWKLINKLNLDFCVWVVSVIQHVKMWSTFKKKILKKDNLSHARNRRGARFTLHLANCCDNSCWSEASLPGPARHLILQQTFPLLSPLFWMSVCSSHMSDFLPRSSVLGDKEQSHVWHTDHNQR